MNVPDSLLYTDSHEWVRADGDTATVGITDHAQAELSDVVYLELPTVGTKVRALGRAGTVESVKAASDVNSPVSGEVVEINAGLCDRLADINANAYDCWMFKVRLSDPSELAALKDAAAYRAAIS